MIDAILGSWAPLASWILFASLKGSVIIACVLLLRRMRWLTPQGRYALWFAVIACLSIPFGAEVSLPDNVQTAAVESVQAASRPAIAEPAAPIIAITDPSGTQGSMVSMQSWLILLWIAGAVMLAAAVLYNTNRYFRIKAASTEADAATRALFLQCKDALKVRRRVRLATTSQTSSPIVVGFWRPTLLLPVELPTQVTQEQLRLVLLHELAHVARHDILVNWLITFVQIVHWFNPLTWYALRAMRADMELACDATVMRNLSGSEQLAYGDTLIRLSDFTPQRTWLVQNASVVDDHSQLRTRITMISKFKPGKVLQSAMAAVLLLLVTAAAITQTSNELPRAQANSHLPQVIISAQAGTPPAEARKPAAADTKVKAPDAAPSTIKPAALQNASIHVDYVKAGDLAAALSKSATGVGHLSAQGSVTVEASTNNLLVRDTPERIAAIRQLVATLDVPPTQVLLEAHIARIDDAFFRDLLAGGVRNMARGSINTLAAEYQLDAELAAGARRQQVEMFSMPRITTANGQKGIVSQGTLNPTTSTLAGDAPSIMKRVALELAVTPTVTPDGQILADVSLKIDSIDSVVTTSTGVVVPAINNSTLFTTQTQLNSGQTLMLERLVGGQFNPYVNPPSDSSKGWRLVVFITPRILGNARK